MDASFKENSGNLRHLLRPPPRGKKLLGRLDRMIAGSQFLIISARRRDFLWVSLTSFSPNPPFSYTQCGPGLDRDEESRACGRVGRVRVGVGCRSGWVVCCVAASSLL